MPSSCTPAILMRISSSDNFNAWKTSTSTTLNGISPMAAGGTIQPSPAEASTLANTSADIFNTTSCIQEKLTEIGGTTNTIQATQEAILDVTKKIEEEEANVAISHDRVAYIRHPERNVSYYESWFPIDRPMQRESVPWFMVVTSFIGIFSILVVLSLIGVDFSFNVSPRLLIFYDWVRMQFTYTTITLILLIMFMLYYFMNTKQSVGK
jgi:hypothetical protein